MGTAWAVGDRIENRWEVLEIRKGGMGVVYIVRDHIWGVVLAAKAFQDEVFSRDRRVAERFTREAEVWISLEDHPNIAQAILVQNVQGWPLIFLEFVQSDLAGLISSGKLATSLPQTLLLAMNFCDGITYAYSKGIKAHRDVKPHNCLITSRGVLKVTDFGLVSVWDVVAEDRPHGEQNVLPSSQASGLTPGGIGLGTPAYMAPEQFLDAGRVDMRADVYAFGIMLYEMVTGSLPFTGRDHLEWLQLHSTVSVPDLTTGMPVELNGLIQGCVQKRAEHRYPNFDQVRTALAKLYEKLTGKPAPKTALPDELDSAQWRRKGIGLADLERLEEALECFERSLECDSDDDSTWQCKGVVLARMGKRSEALACEERAIALNPCSGKAWGSKAVSLLELRRAEEGLQCADRAIELEPGEFSLRTIRTAILNNLNRHMEALDCANEGLGMYPHSDLAWAERGKALRGLDRRDEALLSFERALKLNEKNAEALRGTAEGMIDSGRHQGAIEFLDKALALNPESWALWWDKGVALGALRGPLQQELECFSRCVELAPNIPNAWYSKGLVLHDLGRTEEASECYDRALNLNPEYKDAIKAKAIVLRELGRMDEALTYHVRLVELDPSDATAWNDQGATLCAAGRLQQALECFDWGCPLE